MNEYDIIKIYEQMERELIASMKRNLARHKKEEEKVGFEFSQWQEEKLKSLRKYRHENRTIINTYTKGLNKSVTRLLDESYKDGKRSAYADFIEAKEKGYELDVDVSKSFFKTNSRKANTFIKTINNDLEKANNACLRRSNDIYREVIHKASTFVGNGVYTERKAVDMAIKDFASKGINCIVYKNGARHTISDYSSMAIRTANQRAQLMAEGEFRKKIGETLVTVSKHGTACEICQQFEGRVYIDDVYSGGTKEDGKYPLLSEAMKQGMFHPNCRHGLDTYYKELEEEQIETPKDEAIKEKEELVQNPTPAKNKNEVVEETKGSKEEPKVYTEYSEWAKSLTDDEREALYSYSNVWGISSSKINGYLRSGSINTGFLSAQQIEQVTNDVKKAIKNLDSAISKFKTTETQTLYRGIDIDTLLSLFTGKEKNSLGLKNIEKVLKGNSYIEKGYSSTTGSLKEALKFGNRKYVLEIEVPKGTNLAQMGLTSSYVTEQELLLARNIKYEFGEVIKMEKQRIKLGKKYYDVEVVKIKAKIST